MYIYGINPVLELVKRRPAKVRKIFIARGKGHPPALERVLFLSGQAGIEIRQTEKSELSAMCDSTAHQGIAAEADPPAYRDLFQVLEDKPSPVLVLVLDGITDPQNLGAIIRTAEEAGADAVVIPKDRSCGITPTVIKASAGAVEWIPVCRVTNLNRTLGELKQKGFWIAGADPSGYTAYTDLQADTDLVLVIGSEGKGLRRIIKKACDYLIYIPSQGRIGSLNASVAAAVIMFEIAKKRKGH